MSDVRNIAIVDDHVMVRKGLTALVNLFPNCRVVLDASNGKEFIALLDRGVVPDILLLDIAMPEMDGYATAAWMKEHHPETKILALSTMDAESAIIKMIRNGAKGYVLKDSDPAALKQAFDEVLTLGYYYNEVISRKIVQSVGQLTDPGGDINLFVRLTDREVNFLRLACSEKTYTEIAKEMFVSERTVDGYRDALFKKLNVTTRVGLVMYAIKNGIYRL